MPNRGLDVFKHFTEMVQSSAHLDSLLTVIVLAAMRVVNAGASFMLLIEKPQGNSISTLRLARRVVR